MKKKQFAAFILTLTVLCGVAAYALSGTDSLISTEYLSNTFLPSVLTQTEEKAKSQYGPKYDSAKSELDSAAASYLTRAKAKNPQSDWTQSKSFSKQTYHRSDSVRFSAGSGFILMKGAAVVSVTGGEVIDVTSGVATSTTFHLNAGHRYLVSEGATATLTIRSDTAILTVMGQYSVTVGKLDTLPFTDIISDAWYYSYVEYVCKAGLFNGVDDTTFAPDSPVTRAMLATILHRVAKTPELPTTAPSFTDVPAKEWFATPVRWAASVGIVTGIGNHNFAPQDNVTREQMATMLFRYTTEYMGRDMKPTGELSIFRDAKKISSWANAGISWAVGAGILNGRTDGTLDPKGSATRAEVAAMMQRFSNLKF
ncbi:MAG: S-layer homology domain-containing protein [Evtepia sp.]